LKQPWVTSATNVLNSEGVSIANQTLSVFVIRVPLDPGLKQPWVTSATNVLNSEGVSIANQTLSVFVIRVPLDPRVEATLG
jgi:hypothetical protein